MSLCCSCSAETSFDFIVVGSGPGGATVASRLSEANVSVLLLEAGQAEPLTASVPAAYLDLLQTESAWQRLCPGGEIGKGLEDGMVKVVSGKMLGGSSSLNAMAYVRGNPKDYDSWAAQGATGWSWQEVLPYFKKSEGFVKDGAPSSHVDPDSHGSSGPLSVSFRTEQLESTSKFLAAAEAQGYQLGDYNSEGRAKINADGRGVASPHQFTIRKGARCSAATAFLDPARGRPNLTVRCQCLAQRVLFKDRKATGIEYLDAAGNIQRVQCRKEVILAAGAYATPGILLRSGIGPKEELSKDEVELLLDLPPVGKNLQDHLQLHIPISGEGTTAPQLQSAQGVTGLLHYMLTGKGLLATSVYEASAFYSSGLHPKPDVQDGQISFAPAMSPAVFELLGIKDPNENYTVDAMFSKNVPSGVLIVTLSQPTSCGEVRLAGQDVTVDHKYLAEKGDLDMYIALCKEAARLLEQPSLKHCEVLLPKKIQEKHGTDLQNDKLWEDFIRMYAVTQWHPVGTCAINQVVDPQCRVLGLENLRVADGSVMPHLPSGNTQAPCYMIGEKVAAMVAKQHDLSLA